MRPLLQPRAHAPALDLPETAAVETAFQVGP